MSLISVNLVVHNGEKYIRHFLDSLLKQIYEQKSIEVNILDNASSDSSLEIAHQYKRELGLKFASFNVAGSKENSGMWPGQEKMFEQSNGNYIVAASVDIILHEDFIKNAVRELNSDPAIGAIQAKVYQYNLEGSGGIKLSNVFDTCGFQIFRSRRITNIAHGETDIGQYDKEQEIFAVEGAVPIFRKQALEDCRLKSQNNKFADPDFFWYGDDLDLAWRMRLFGWKQKYLPDVIAWHDRKTTKTLAGDKSHFIKIRKNIPLFKRQLDWRNVNLAIIKNDFALNYIYDLPYILWRQARLWAYFVLFEPSMFKEILHVAKLTPKMLKRRLEIMRKSKVSSQNFHKWIM